MKHINLFIPITRKKLYILVWCVSFLVGFSSFSTKAQTIKGTIKSASGETIPGATIVVKGTTRGTNSGKNGDYAITVSPKETLIFSSVGFKPQEVLVGNKTSINIVLEEFQSALDEVGRKSLIGPKVR